jgi:hypothetical protein
VAFAFVTRWSIVMALGWKLTIGSLARCENCVIDKCRSDLFNAVGYEYAR